MEASSGSILQFANGTQTPYNNAGGIIRALNRGTVQLQNGIYTGGSLTTTGTGVTLAENSAILNGLTTGGAVQVPTANQASQNTITNTGTVSVPSSTLSATTGNLSNAGTITIATASNTRVGGSYTQTAGKTTVDGTLTAPTGLLLQNGTLQGQGTIWSAITSHATPLLELASSRLPEATARLELVLWMLPLAVIIWGRNTANWLCRTAQVSTAL